MKRICLFDIKFLFLFIAAPIISSAYAQEIIAPTALIQQLPKQGIHHVEGYVTGYIICPPCPADALCEPCLPEAFLLSDKNRAQAIEADKDLPEDTIVINCNKPRNFKFGKKYQIILEVTERHTTAYKLNDLQLKEAKEITN